MAEELNNNLNADELAALAQGQALIGPPAPGGLGNNNNNDNNNNNWNNNNAAQEMLAQMMGLDAAPGGPPAPGNNNNDDGDDVDWPENDENDAPAAAPPPAAPQPPKPKKFATDLTPAEKVALQSPRPATPAKFDDTIKTRVEEALYDIFKPGFDLLSPGKTKAECIAALRALLKKHKAILSGGFLLRLILNIPAATWALQPLNFYNSLQNAKHSATTKLDTQINSGLDIDFYVNCNELVPFYSALIPLFQAAECIGHEASFYCQSFLRKNGIRTVYKCKRPTVAGINELDIMAVRNKRTPLDVVTNFDLTVCQVWYDGDSVKATDPEHVLNKVTYLQGDYVKTYIQGNSFLDWRLKKYTRRGFKIVADPAALGRMSPLDAIARPDSYNGSCGALKSFTEGRYWSAEFKRKWLVRALLRKSVTGSYHVHQASGDSGVKKTIQYNPATRQLTEKLRPMDGYDTDDFVENIQLLRDRIVTEDPLKIYAADFLSLFSNTDATNPFFDVVNHQYYLTNNKGYKKILDLKDDLDEVLASFSAAPAPAPEPAATGGKRRLTRKRK